MSGWPVFVTAGAALVSLIACGPPAAHDPAPPDPPAPSATVRFADATLESGLASFRQVNGTAEKLHITDETGAGVALFDADGDGDLDVFLVNGAAPPGSAGPPPSNALYRNEGELRLRDVTAESGLLSHGAWGQGVAVADVDGDGHLDMYLANHGPDVLYLNRGDGTFRDATAASGLGDPDWSTGAAFLDQDRDGDLDLYVANYIAWEDFVRANPHGTISLWKGLEVAAGPMGLPPARDRFYRNRGDGAFSDATVEAGLAVADHGCGFQPTVTDFDDDGWPDVFVANDADGNFLWRNRGDGTFVDVALEAGVRYLDSGHAQSCMGVAVDDYDRDGRLDVFVTNFSEDMNTLYRNRGNGRFENRTAEAGLATPSAWRSLGWGTFFFDADSDGDLDLFVANGHVFPQASQVPDGSYPQANFLYLNRGDGRFEDVSLGAGPGLAVVKVSRGAAWGDLDGDGDLDIVVNNLDDTPTLLRNDSPQGHWLKLILQGRGANRSAIGARVTVHAAGRSRTREVRSSDSFLSHGDLRIHFGLGDATRAERVEVRWPDGSVESAAGLEAGSLHAFVQGQGRVGTRPLR